MNQISICSGLAGKAGPLGPECSKIKGNCPSVDFCWKWPKSSVKDAWRFHLSWGIWSGGWVGVVEISRKCPWAQQPWGQDIESEAQDKGTTRKSQLSIRPLMRSLGGTGVQVLDGEKTYKSGNWGNPGTQSYGLHKLNGGWEGCSRRSSTESNAHLGHHRTTIVRWVPGPTSW